MSIKLLPLILKIGIKEDLDEKVQVDKRQKIKHYVTLSALYLLNTAVIAGASFMIFI